MTDLTAVCLFDGVGGFPLALSRAGIRTVLSCEIDPSARGVLADHFDHPIHPDVTELTADDCLRAGFVSERGIICAGWPCQGNSSAGRRQGMADARSGLWVHVARLLAELRPRWFLGENVPGLLSVNGGWDFATVIGNLAELGYGVAWRVLDAQHFGVPQRRRRVVIVGCLGDRAAPVQVLLEPESVSRDSASGSAAREIASALTANGLGGGGADDNLAQGRHIVGFDLAQITSSVNRSNPKPGDPMTPLVAGGQPHIAHALPVSLAVAGDFSSSEDVAQTVRAAHGQPGVVTTTAVRRLTPLECERLQGFPDNWTATSNGKPQADSPRYRQMGNAIAVPVFEWVARRIAAVDAKEAVA